MRNQIDNLPIIDAKMPISLSITQKDIDSARVKAPNACAAAVACKKKLHAREVRVHLSRIYVRYNDQNWMRYMTPRSLRSEIVAFDRGGKFEAGDFVLSAPQPSKKLGTERESYVKTGKRAKTRRPAKHIKNVRVGPQKKQGH